MKPRITCKVDGLGVYRMRGGELAVIHAMNPADEVRAACAFGTRGDPPKHEAWDLEGRTYYRKYDLVERLK